MRYATMVQPHPDKPPHLVGIGETRDAALAAARVWFRAEFDRTSSKDWPGLIALQDQLTVSTEEEFAARTGVGLDDWLARMAATGVAPATAPASINEPVFTDEFIDDRNGWGIIEPGEFGSVSYSGGDYVWDFRGSVAHWLPAKLADQFDRGEFDMDEVVIETSFTIVDGTGVAGVFCGETAGMRGDFSAGTLRPPGTKSRRTKR